MNYTKPAQLMTRLCIIVALSTLSFSFTAFAPGEAQAQSRSFEEGRPVRRQLLYRTARLSVTPNVGFLFGGAYEVPFYLGVTTRYNLTNSFGIGLDLNGSPAAFNRSVVRDLQSNNPVLNRQTSIASTPLLTNLHVTYSPIVGKVNMFRDSVAHFDFHLIAGVGGALQVADASAIDGFKIGAVVGAGTRVFINDGLALNLRVLDYFYPNAEAARQFAAPEEKWRHHFMFQVGISFFLPSTVYISR